MVTQLQNQYTELSAGHEKSEKLKSFQKRSSTLLNYCKQTQDNCGLLWQQNTTNTQRLQIEDMFKKEDTAVKIQPYSFIIKE